MDFLSALEHSALSTWVKTSPSLWAYSFVLFAHTVGLSLLVGTSVAVNLRLLGMARGLPLAPLDRFFRVMWIGFWINAVSGAVLFAADATTKAANPAFYVKMGFILVAVVDLAWIRRTIFRQPRADNTVPVSARVLAVVSLLCWTGAITAGRLMAYIGQDSGAHQFINRIGGGS